MLEGREFSPDVLSDLARQSAGRLRTLLGERRGTVHLSDTFEVWMLPAGAIAQAAKERTPVDAAAKFTERFHHQVELDGAAVGFIRSKFSGERLIVTEVHVSDLASRIESGLIRIARQTKNLVNVRLLAVPAYYLHAILLAEREHETHVLMLTEPGGKRLRAEELRLLPSTAFLEYLERAPRPKGVLQPEDPRPRH